MNTRPIETALDADLRQSLQAMQRAARRARELVEQTGTALVISRNGVVEQVYLPHDDSGQQCREPVSIYPNNDTPSTQR